MKHSVQFSSALAPVRGSPAQSPLGPVRIEVLHPTLAKQKRSLFVRQGDYWMIAYQRQLAFLKHTRGLHDLALLLRNPGREFHVCELVWQNIGGYLLPEENRHTSRAAQGGLLADAGPILDAQAKAEYKHRLDDLQRDLEEAERFNDPSRADLARGELNAFAEQLAAAVGLGGRDRRAGSEAERARSAVTKRIKGSIKRIGAVIPMLGAHLSTRVRTGYFCSYKPHPERPVAWKF